MQPSNKKVILAVTNDLVTDNRVHKVALSLQKMGFEPLLVGRMLCHSKLIKRPYPTQRLQLLFNKSALFYANYNIRLFFYLLFTRFDIIVANDLDALPACFLVSKLKKKTLVYDSHEYYTEVPELIGRKLVKRCWERIEEAILPKIKNAYTVCDSIAQVYGQKYSVEFKVVRNVPLYTKILNPSAVAMLPIFNDKALILYQGAVNLGRGLDQAIMAMHKINDARLLIVGDGDILNRLKAKVISEKLDEKVIFTGRKALEEVRLFTAHASIGLSIEEDLGLNYRFALPNKLFDYIHAGVPVLTTALPEMARIVNEFNIGCTISKPTPELISEKINEMLSNSDQLNVWKENCIKAKAKLCWENEEEVLKSIYLQLK